MCSRGENEKDGNEGTYDAVLQRTRTRRRKSDKPIGRLSDTAFSRQIYNKKVSWPTVVEDRPRESFMVERLSS